MKNLLRNAANGLLAPLGFKLSRTVAADNQRHLQHAMPTCEDRLAHAHSIGFNAKCIIDAGAFRGDWTRKVSQIFTDAEFLVLEPNPHIQSQLKETLATLQDRVTIVQKAVAHEVSSMSFHIWGDPKQATSASLHSHVRGDSETTVSVEVDTIDRLITEYELNPQLIKLDLQGAELKALAGSIAALKTTELFIVEFGCLQAYVDRTTPRQLMDVFYDNDYCLYDIVDCHYRPYDGALTGGDFFFVKNSSALKSHVDYE